MKTNFLKQLLYIPNYLSLPVAGIEICNKSIKYIEFFDKKGVLSVRNFGEIILAPDIIKNGDILNKNALVKALTEIKNKISSDFIRVSIPEEKTYIFEVKMPKEAITNIREALEFKIEENVPLKLEEVSFEYEIVDDNKTTGNITINVSVIPKKIIFEYTEIFDQVGIYPLSYEIESKMIAKSVIPKSDKINSIIINIKDDSTVFIAVVDGFVRTTSSISIGESTIKENLLKTGLSRDELTNNKFFKNDFSFETTFTAEISSSLINIFSVFKDEVNKFNEYILNKFPDIKTSSAKKIDKIILCGKYSMLPGLTKHINQDMQAEITLANAWSNVFDIKEKIPYIKFYDSLDFVVPIGLVISSYK